MWNEKTVKLFLDVLFPQTQQIVDCFDSALQCQQPTQKLHITSQLT